MVGLQGSEQRDAGAGAASAEGAYLGSPPAEACFHGAGFGQGMSPRVRIRPRHATTGPKACLLCNVQLFIADASGTLSRRYLSGFPESCV